MSEPVCFDTWMLPDPAEHAPPYYSWTILKSQVYPGEEDTVLTLCSRCIIEWRRIDRAVAKLTAHPGHPPVPVSIRSLP